MGAFVGQAGVARRAVAGRLAAGLAGAVYTDLAPVAFVVVLAGGRVGAVASLADLGGIAMGV